MLSTTALEKYIKKEICSKLGEVGWNCINFKKGYKYCIEGTYIYSQNNTYHILYVEKGEIRELDSNVVASGIFGFVFSSLIYKLRNNEEIEVIELYKEMEKTFITKLQKKEK